MRTLGFQIPTRILEEAKPEANTLTEIQCKALIGSFLILVIVIAYCLVWVLCRQYGRSTADDCPSTGGNCRRRSSKYQRVLDTLPVAAYSGPLSEGESCAICLAEYEANDVVRILPICDHFLHMDCLDRWLLRSLMCPICRAPVTDAKTDDGDRAGNEEDRHQQQLHFGNFYNCPVPMANAAIRISLI